MNLDSQIDTSPELEKNVFDEKIEIWNQKLHSAKYIQDSRDQFGTFKNISSEVAQFWSESKIIQNYVSSDNFEIGYLEKFFRSSLEIIQEINNYCENKVPIILDEINLKTSLLFFIDEQNILITDLTCQVINDIFSIDNTNLDKKNLYRLKQLKSKIYNFLLSSGHSNNPNQLLRITSSLNSEIKNRFTQSLASYLNNIG